MHGRMHIKFRVLRTFESEVELVILSRRRRKTRIGHITDVDMSKPEKEMRHVLNAYEETRFVVGL